MNNTERYERLKKRLASVTMEVNQVKGEYNAYMKKLNELGFSSVEEAEAYVKIKKQEAELKEAEFNKKLDEFEVKIKEAESVVGGVYGV